jgi:hypothetical protein
MTISFSILEYLGTIANGVLVLLSVVYDNNYSEATLFYNKKEFLITISEELEIQLGGKIEILSEYKKIVVDLQNKVVPFEQIVNRLDPVDISRWTKQVN